MSRRFKIILSVRFAGYFVFLTGLISLIFMLGPLIKAEAGYRWDRTFNVRRVLSDNAVIPQQQDSSGNVGTEDNTSFGNIQASDETIIPVSTEYGIVIEKINANARIISNVNPANEREYVQALTQGVAEAAGSTLPGQPGNLYLFSHSTDAPWNIVRFNAIFYLLKELETGDKVVIFYQNKRYDYIVFDKVIAGSTDVSYLTNRYEYPVLTLQTCDPPGTILNRLIVRAKLVNS